ncbi:MAG: hypothetical protein WD066_03725 [Planctomycetaceae bacterium]
MKPKRLSLLLAAMCLALFGLGLAAWLVPYYRERAALAELDRIGIYVPHLSSRAWTPKNGSGVLHEEDLFPRPRIEMAKGGPDWLRRLVGDKWMEPFDRVGMVDLTHSYNSPFLGPAEQDRSYQLLTRLRSIDHLIVGYGTSGDSRLDQIRACFPKTTVSDTMIPRIPPFPAHP